MLPETSISRIRRTIVYVKWMRRPESLPHTPVTDLKKSAEMVVRRKRPAFLLQEASQWMLLATFISPKPMWLSRGHPSNLMWFARWMPPRASSPLSPATVMSAQGEMAALPPVRNLMVHFKLRWMQPEICISKKLVIPSYGWSMLQPALLLLSPAAVFLA